MAIEFLNIGLKPYREVLKLQEELHAKRLKAKICDTVIFCEHPPVFTTGRQDASSDWISDFQAIASDGIEIVNTNRGGRITYHGPGQLIVYFIFNIAERKIGIKEFVNKVEDVCMKTLAEFGIAAMRDKEHPGLWVNNKKIVALGFHVSQGITMHGVALNIDPNMKHYRHIIPCGIRGCSVTSMREMLGTAPKTDDVIKITLDYIKQRF